MFCIKCGKNIDPSVESCPDCGTKVVLPDGFDPHTENTVKMDIDMLIGEKTVSADHSAIARKAAAAASASTAPEALSAEPVIAPVAPAAPVMQDSVPRSPAGFDLNSARKIMNGRSILIDDSPLPGVVPAYIASAPVQASQPVSQAQFVQSSIGAEKPQDKKALILIIAAAVLGIALVAVIIFFFLGEKKNEDNGVAAVATENRTEEATKNNDKESFTSDKTGVDIIGGEDATGRFPFADDEAEDETQNRDDASVRPPSNRPQGSRPTLPFEEESDGEDDVSGNESDTELNNSVQDKQNQLIAEYFGVSDETHKLVDVVSESDCTRYRFVVNDNNGYHVKFQDHYLYTNEQAYFEAMLEHGDAVAVSDKDSLYIAIDVE